MTFETYLKNKGFQEKAVECVCPHCVTVAEFALTHQKGRFVLICQDRAVMVADGKYADINDCGTEIVLYYFQEVS